MNNTADAMYFAVTKVYNLATVTEWIKDNPRIAVRGIYPDNGGYLIVHWKTVEEIMKIRKELEDIGPEYPGGSLFK